MNLNSKIKHINDNCVQNLISNIQNFFTEDELEYVMNTILQKLVRQVMHKKGWIYYKINKEHMRKKFLDTDKFVICIIK